MKALVNRFVVVVTCVWMAAALSSFAVLHFYLRSVSQDFVRSFLATEAISLQEGNVLPVFSKGQRLLLASQIISGIAVVNAPTGHRLYELGEPLAMDALDLGAGEFRTRTIGIFSYRMSYGLNGGLVAIFESRWRYALFQLLLALGAIAAAVAWLAWYSARLSRREAAAKFEFENRAQLQLGSFAAQVAHDIRSPLTALKVATGRLEGLPADTRGLIDGAASRIQTLANELLAISRRGQGQADGASASTTSISDCIRQIVDEKRVEYADRPRLTIALDGLAKADVRVTMAHASIQRIVSNLINNSADALEQPGGKIVVQVRVDDSFAHVTVADDGPGIAPELLAKLGKERMSFGKDGHSTSGAGLGLFSARQMAEASGGRLQIISKPGVGTQVRLSLVRHEDPLKDAHRGV